MAELLARRTALAVCAVLAACDKGGGGGDKEAYQKAIADTKDMIGVISAFLPHLEPKPGTGKYAPQRRPDLDRGATFAGNAIRSAANRARQKLQGEGTAVATALAEPFIAVTKACADAQDSEAAAKCKSSVNALDAALQEASSKATAAGATESFPRVGAAAIGEAGKKELGPLLTAMGGGKDETAFYAKLEDAAASAQDVVNACQAAEDEGTVNMKAVEKIDEEARKTAAVHREMIKAVCARVGRADAARAGLASCLEEKEKKKKLGKEREEECVLVCTAGKAAVDEGIPAATFSKIPGLYKDFCEKK